VAGLARKARFASHGGLAESIALRDARSVRDAIGSGQDLPIAFGIRRLRANAMAMAAMAADNCDDSISVATSYSILQTDPDVPHAGGDVRWPGDGAGQGVQRPPGRCNRRRIIADRRCSAKRVIFA